MSKCHVNVKLRHSHLIRSHMCMSNFRNHTFVVVMNGTADQIVNFPSVHVCVCECVYELSKVTIVYRSCTKPGCFCMGNDSL